MDSELKRYVIDNYQDIDDIDFIEDVKEGYLSQNFFLNSNDKRYFLKQYRERFNEKDVQEIHSVIDIFYKNNIPAIQAIKTETDKSFFLFKNKIYALFPFVTGVKVDREDISLEAIKSIATTLAETHLISLNGPAIDINKKQGPIHTSIFSEDSRKIFSKIKNIEKKTDFDNLALKVLSLKMELSKKYRKKMGNFRVINDHLLHGDYHEKNLFLDLDSSVKYIFDFEKTKLGDRLSEVVRSMDFICLNGEYSKENIEKARCYIETYTDVYPFEYNDFLNALEGYWFKKANSLWIEKTHYIDNSCRVDCFLGNELKLLEYFPSNYIELAEKLYN